MQLVPRHNILTRYRLPALFCALAVLVCELIAHPYTTMSVCDDGPYILMAHTLATTGHIVYNGWAAPMLGWQLYLGAAFIKLFGFSFTAVRMSTIFIAMLMAFLLQRSLVAANITERNATLATLTFVLSPLYLMLSATYMTDIYGLFAVVICLYACLRALQATTNRSTLAWLLFAILSNALCGTSRQIGWLGILVMVPSTLFLLRSKRQVLLTGIIANLAAIAFIFASLHWLKLQPYSIPEHILPPSFHVGEILWTLVHFFLETPFLLLPIIVLFFPTIRKSTPRAIVIICALILGYLFLATYPSHLRGYFLLEPTAEDWVSAFGTYLFVAIHGAPYVVFNKTTQILLTIVSLGSLLGLIATFFHSRPTPPETSSTPAVSSKHDVSWHQLGILLVPFTLTYSLLLIPRAATTGISDRYLLEPLIVALLCLTRYYQGRTQQQLPFVSVLLVGIMALYGTTITHNTFSFYRARVALADELAANGAPPTSVDNGWEYNILTELQHANHLNFPGIAVPPDAYTPTPPLPAGTCSTYLFDYTPHVRPLYGISFDPTACYGPALFAPVHYSRWFYRTPGTLYVVNYLASTKP